MNRAAIIFLSPDREEKQLSSHRFIIIDNDGIDISNRPIMIIETVHCSIYHFDEMIYKIHTAISTYEVGRIYKIDCAKVTKEGIEHVVREIAKYI